MLDLTVPMVEVWFSGAKLGEYANDLEALKAASLHADSLPLTTEKVEYELRRDTMKYIVHRRIVGPDAPALGPVLTISSSALTVTLDRPASGPTTIDRYELERYNGSAWVQIATGLNIFGAGNAYPDSGLAASTAYQYRARAVDTTERVSEWSYSSSTTSAGATNTAPVWATTVTKTIQAGSSASITASDCSDPESDQITFSKVSVTPPNGNITVSGPGIISIAASVVARDYDLTVKADDGSLSANKVITVTVSAAASGNTFTVPPGTATYDAAANGVQPGDTIIVSAFANGTRGPLKFTNVNGTSGSPIYIKNPSGTVVTIRSSSNGSGFRFHIDSGHDFVVDGSNGMAAWSRTSPSGKCGFIVTYSSATGADSPTAFVQVSNRCYNFTIKRIEIQGGYSANASRGIGIQVKDQSVTRTANPGAYWENIVIKENFINQTGNSGMYIGGNYSANECPMKNVEITDNAITNIAQAGITAKGWWSGTNSIHDNLISVTGTYVGTPNQRGGISLFSGQASIYDNIILDASQGGTTQTPNGITCYTGDGGPVASVSETGYGTFSNFDVYCYNNVIARAAKYGMRAYRAPATPALATVTPYFYNNTVVDSGDLGILVEEGGSGLVRNNIVLGNNGGGTQISSDATTADNLISGVTVSACFVSPETDNYHLTAERAAVDGAGTDISSADIEGTSRAGTASKGAYEYA